MVVRTYDKIKNFSTSIKSENTIQEIEFMLSKYGASKIMKEYDSDQQPCSLSFIILTEKGNIPIKLPLRVDNIVQIFNDQVKVRKLPKSYMNNKAQAYRVGWRIIKDWLDAQLTIYGIGMTKLEEVLLPYIYNSKTNQTMFEYLEQEKMLLPQLENKISEQDIIVGRV